MLSESARRRTLAKRQQMSENLARISSLLLEKTQEGVTAIEQLKSAMEQIAAASEENAGAAEESLSAINEISRNAEMIEKDTEFSVQRTVSLVEVARGAQKDVLNAAEQMLEMVSTSEALGEQAQGLRKASEEIGASVSLIAQVAEEINLLALNAAIEAARAKEQGRGFAVVAGETRSLAAQSAESAELTRQVVEEIQKQIGDVVEGISKVADQSAQDAPKAEQAAEQAKQIGQLGDQVVKHAHALGEAISTLVDEIGNLQKGAEVIASVAEEQASAVAQATKAIDMQAVALA